MSFSVDQVVALAPDSGAVAAAKKLAQTTAWRGLGQSPRALWGECRGSALYQVRVDRADLAVKCSCPSRKFPCKHGLGLLLLAADAPSTLPPGEPPEWVSDWLAKRAPTGSHRTARPGADTAPDAAPGSSNAPSAPTKRAEKRLAQVAKGLDSLDLWLNDLIRTGLADLEGRGAAFWESQAARLVDAQAPGVAARLRRLAEIPHSAPNWPDRLLGQLGRLALLAHAFRRIAELEPALQDDVRQAIGWTLSQEEVIARGQTVADDWLVVGQRVSSEERLRVQRTWLLGAQTGRSALILHFSAGGAPFPEVLMPSLRQAAELVYWPSAYPQRALIGSRHGSPEPIQGNLPGSDTIDQVLDQVARATACQPWLDRFLCVLRRAVPVCAGDRRWWAQDRADARLPLTPDDHWRLLALSGGAPIDLVGEWDGAALLPLGALVDGAYHHLGGMVRTGGTS